MNFSTLATSINFRPVLAAKTAATGTATEQLLLGINKVGDNVLSYIPVNGGICTKNDLNISVNNLIQYDADNLTQLNTTSSLLSTKLIQLESKIDRTSILSATDYRFGTIKLFAQSDNLPANYHPVQLSDNGNAYVYVNDSGGGSEPADYAQICEKVNNLYNVKTYYCDTTNKNIVQDNYNELNQKIQTNINHLNYLSDKIDDVWDGFDIIAQFDTTDEDDPKLSGGLVYDLSVQLLGLSSMLLKTIYPINSIYCTYTDTNPNNILKFGTWELITTQVLSSISITENPSTADTILTAIGAENGTAFTATDIQQLTVQLYIWKRTA